MTKEIDQNETWFEQEMRSTEFRRHLEWETLVDELLTKIDSAMGAQGVTRSELARRLKCKPANVTKALRHSNNLKLSTVVYIGFALGLRLKASFEPITEELPTNLRGDRTSGGSVHYLPSPQAKEMFDGTEQDESENIELGLVA